MNGCVAHGIPVPDELVGELLDSSSELSDPAELRRRIEEHGYVFLRDVLNRDEVLAAREEVMTRLMEVGEIQSPAVEGIATGHSNRTNTVDDLHGFWKSVSKGVLLRRVSHGSRVGEIVDLILGEPSRAHDLLYLRPAVPGRATRLHYDYPFFAGFSRRIHTVWIPLGDVPVTDGPLVMVEGSNRFSDLINPFREIDYQSNHSNDTVQQAAYEKQNTTDPISLACERETRLLTTDYRAGDLMLFSGFLMHGSLDNHSPMGRTRLSCDIRYQPADDSTADDRYFGPNPKGSNGGGYGDMKGAKPLNESW